MPEAVIVSTARSPIGRAFKGSLVDMRPDERMPPDPAFHKFCNGFLLFRFSDKRLFQETEFRAAGP